jgi:hypothetical protein
MLPFSTVKPLEEPRREFSPDDGTCMVEPRLPARETLALTFLDGMGAMSALGITMSDLRLDEADLTLSCGAATGMLTSLPTVFLEPF